MKPIHGFIEKLRTLTVLIALLTTDDWWLESVSGVSRLARGEDLKHWHEKSESEEQVTYASREDSDFDWPEKKNSWEVNYKRAKRRQAAHIPYCKIFGSNQILRVNNEVEAAGLV